MKITKYFNFTNIFNYLIILSPIILSSFFIYGSKYPAWANTLFLASLLSLLLSFKLIYDYKSGKDVSKLQIIIILSAFIYIIYSLITSRDYPLFTLFGKGLQEWRSAGVLLYFLAFAYFVNLRGRLNKTSIFISLIALFYTLLNYFLIRYNINIASSSSYLNVPMISFAKLFNFAFIYTLVTLAASLIAFILEKKNLEFEFLKKKKWYYLPLIIIFLLVSVTLYRDTLRYLASRHYYLADTSYKSGDLELARSELKRASVIAPFDEYYLASAEVTSAMINKFLAENSTTTAATSNIYKEYIGSQLEDTFAATKYDSRSARNYMALGFAYERSMLLNNDDGYKNAMQAYNKARVHAIDKDYVDVTKAKLAFGNGKEEEAVSHLKSALEYNPKSPTALFTFSQYYASKNKIVEAINYGEQAVAIAPNAPDVRLSLGILYLRNNDNTKAVDTFGEVYRLSNGQNLAAIYYIGVAYANLKDVSNLESVIKELENRIDKESDEIRYLKRLLDNIKANETLVIKEESKI